MSMRDLIPWGSQSGTAPTAWRDEAPSPLLGFRREMDRLFDDFFRGGFPGLSFGRGISVWPRVEIGDSEREVRITAEMPGMSEKDVELLIEDGALTLRGERKSEREDRDPGYSERYYGRFERRIALPSDVDEERAKAEFRDGVLTVTLPRTGAVDRGRRIPINADTRH